jgi:hypothetical protein
VCTRISCTHAFCVDLIAPVAFLVAGPEFAVHAAPASHGNNEGLNARPNVITSPVITASIHLALCMQCAGGERGRNGAERPEEPGAVPRAHLVHGSCCPRRPRQRRRPLVRRGSGAGGEQRGGAAWWSPRPPALAHCCGNTLALHIMQG